MAWPPPPCTSVLQGLLDLEPSALCGAGHGSQLTKGHLVPTRVGLRGKQGGQSAGMGWGGVLAPGLGCELTSPPRAAGSGQQAVGGGRWRAGPAAHPQPQSLVLGRGVSPSPLSWPFHKEAHGGQGAGAVRVPWRIWSPPPPPPSPPSFTLTPRQTSPFPGEQFPIRGGHTALNFSPEFQVLRAISGLPPTRLHPVLPL